ncbi:hypothetical protein Q8A73_004230 [Channa argus]|nr:hypothetical protein Q8A73_004230 [Channa argus]
MDEWREEAFGRCFFACVQKFASGGETGLCLSLFIPPHLSIHLSISSPLSVHVTMAPNICGYQVIMAEPKQRGSGALTGSSTLQLALHLHLPSLCGPPDDQRVPIRTPRRPCASLPKTSASPGPPRGRGQPNVTWTRYRVVRGEQEKASGRE